MSTATVTPSVSTTPTTPTTTTPTTTTPGSGGGEGAAGSESTRDAIKSLSISYEDGATPETLSLEDVTAPVGDTTDTFKFSDLDEIKDNEKLYKPLKAKLSQLERYSKAFKSPEDLKAHLDRIDKLVKSTGITDRQGIDAIEHSIGTLAHTLQSVQNGDKEVITRWFNDNPSGMAALIDNSLEALSKSDPNAFSAVHAKVAWNTLSAKDSYGQSAVDALNALYEVVKDKPEAIKLLQRAAHTVNQIASAAQYKPDQSAVLAKQAKNLEQQKAQLWEKETDLAINPIVDRAARTALSAFVSQAKKQLSPEERATYVEELTKTFFDKASKDPGFIRTLQELRKNLDRDGIISLVKANRAKYMNEAMKDLYRSKLLNRQEIRDDAASHSEAGGGSSSSSSSKAIMYTGKMKNQAPDVAYDYPRMRAEDPNMLYNHEFYIVGQKNKYRW